MVAAIRAGVHESSGLELLGYADPRRTSAALIFSAGADVLLIDEADRSEPTIDLIRAVKERHQDIQMIVLASALEGDWLERAFEAGADGAICKSVHPAALGTLVREAVNGHIVHAPASLRSTVAAPAAQDGRHSSLTDREFEILSLVASGATNGVIARQLWITQQTVKFHLSNIYRKLGVANRTEACNYAHVNGIASVHGAVEKPRRILAIAS
jgi:DNA-binding NarL/FixJ family response regulator